MQSIDVVLLKARIMRLWSLSFLSLRERRNVLVSQTNSSILTCSGRVRSGSNTMHEGAHGPFFLRPTLSNIHLFQSKKLNSMAQNNTSLPSRSAPRLHFFKFCLKELYVSHSLSYTLSNICLFKMIKAHDYVSCSLLPTLPNIISISLKALNAALMS